MQLLAPHSIERPVSAVASAIGVIPASADGSAVTPGFVSAPGVVPASGAVPVAGFSPIGIVAFEHAVVATKAAMESPEAVAHKY